MRIITNFSPNCPKSRRKQKNIKFIVLHYTGMQSAIESINRLKNIKFKVSCHYLITRTGKIIRMVNDDREAWHAGKSKWFKFKNLNKYSIGIELVNKGHHLGYENFPKKQIKSLIKLCKNLKKKYKIKQKNVLGHSDIAPSRKKDPGEKFPWKELSYYGLGKWYRGNLSCRNLNLNKSSENKFFKCIYKIGYRYFNPNKREKKKDKYVIKAFQLRYNPKNVTGKLDPKTLKISQLLAKSY